MGHRTWKNFLENVPFVTDFLNCRKNGADLYCKTFYGRNKILTAVSQYVTARGQCYKTSVVRNLRIFVISQSLCPCQCFTAQSYKHFSLVRKLVSYAQKKFYNVRPRSLPRWSNICGQDQQPTLRGDYRKGLYSGKLRSCQKILDKSGSDQWPVLQPCYIVTNHDNH